MHNACLWMTCAGSENFSVLLEENQIPVIAKFIVANEVEHKFGTVKS